VLIIGWAHIPCSEVEPYAMSEYKTVKALTFRRSAVLITANRASCAPRNESGHYQSLWYRRGKGSAPIPWQS
jgi:hypothetical protein